MQRDLENFIKDYECLCYEYGMHISQVHYSSHDNYPVIEKYANSTGIANHVRNIKLSEGLYDLLNDSPKLSHLDTKFILGEQDYNHPMPFRWIKTSLGPVVMTHINMSGEYNGHHTVTIAPIITC